MKQPKIHHNALILEGAIIKGDVTIDQNVSVWYNAVIRADLAPITIGENSNIQECCVLHVDTNFPVKIGKNVTVGHNAVLHGCEIGDQVLIGMGAIILNGAKIGDNSIVGAGALVTQNTVVPNNSLIFGNPAKVKREVSEEEIKATIANAEEYVKLMKEFI